jgi:hypothetical protein
MKKSELKQIIKEEINELFGLSKKEKEEKEFKGKLEKAEKEIDNFNPSRLFREPAANSSNSDLFDLIRYPLAQAKKDFPTVYELLPFLFGEGNGEKISPSTALLRYPSAKDGYLKGVIPSSFWFVLDQYTIMPTEKARERMKEEFRKLIDRKYNQGEPKYSK